MYAHDVKGLVEAPMQAVYTLTLISLRFLDTPQKSSKDDRLIFKNSFGQSISLSFFPIMSLAFSFVAIVIKSGKAIKILDIWKSKRKREVLTWICCICSTAIFRIQVPQAKSYP
jgi:hypothetical protein